MDWDVGTEKHRIKISCSIHRTCVVFKQAKKLPSNGRQRVKDWLVAGLSRFDGRTADEHKSILNVTWFKTTKH